MKILSILKSYFAFNGVVSSIMSIVNLSLAGTFLLAIPGYAYYAHRKVENLEVGRTILMESIQEKSDSINVLTQKCDSITENLQIEIKNLKEEKAKQEYKVKPLPKNSAPKPKSKGWSYPKTGHRYRGY